MNLQVGQRVWVKRIENEARGLDNRKAGIEEYISEAEVVSLRRKFFTLEAVDKKSSYFGNSKFFLDTGLDDRKGYASGYQVYLSRQEILDEVEAKNLYHEIRREYFDMRRKPMTLEQLRGIRDILNKSEKE